MEKDNVIEMENKNNVIELNTIKFKAIQYFSDPPMMMVFSKLKCKAMDNYKTLILMKRIKEALAAEGQIIDSVIKDIRERYAEDNPIVEGDKALNPMLVAKINEYLFEHEVNLPLPKIKLSQINGIESLSDLDMFEGIIEIDIE